MSNLACRSPAGCSGPSSGQKSSLNGTPKGFIHFLDAYLAGTDLTAYEVIDFKSTAQCPATILATTKLPCLNGKPGFVTEGWHLVLPGHLHDRRQRDGEGLLGKHAVEESSNPLDRHGIAFLFKERQGLPQGRLCHIRPAHDRQDLGQVHLGVSAKDQIGHSR